MQQPGNLKIYSGEMFHKCYSVTNTILDIWTDLFLYVWQEIDMISTFGNFLLPRPGEGSLTPLFIGRLYCKCFGDTLALRVKYILNMKYILQYTFLDQKWQPFFAEASLCYMSHPIRRLHWRGEEMCLLRELFGRHQIIGKYLIAIHCCPPRQ